MHARQNDFVLRVPKKPHFRRIASITIRHSRVYINDIKVRLCYNIHHSHSPPDKRIGLCILCRKRIGKYTRKRTFDALRQIPDLLYRRGIAAKHDNIFIARFGGGEFIILSKGERYTNDICANLKMRLHASTQRIKSRGN